MSREWKGGKGDKKRPVKDAEQFAANWDRIFSKKAVDDAADVMSGFAEELRKIDVNDLAGTTNFELAGDFMNAFGQEVLVEPTLPSHDLAKLRLELIREEVEELTVATNAMDMVEIADALTDILYVVYGAGHAFGIDLDACYAEVHRSNMSKLGEDGKPIYREDGKVLKGPNYFHPNLEKILDGAL